MMKFRPPVILVLILIATAVGLLGAAKGKYEPEPPFVPSELIWLFGMIPRDATVTHHFALTNPHKDTITILNIDADCECTKVPKTPISIGPGETYLMKVDFDTRSYVGETNRDIKVTTDYDSLPMVVFYFSSLVGQTPRTITITPPVTAFIPGKNEQSFTVENLSDMKTDFTVLIDHDSAIVPSETEFSLRRGKSQELTLRPVWDKVPQGYSYSCVVLEYTRNDTSYQASIPITLNKY
jgi:hypothetical protein